MSYSDAVLIHFCSIRMSTEFRAERIKHLEFIQSIIARIAGNSAVMKRYCIILVAASAGLFKYLDDPRTIFSGIILILVFWILDARYLMIERCYRELYNEVRKELSDLEPDFRLDISEMSRKKNKIFVRIFSWSTAGLYFPLLILLVLLWISQYDC